MLDIAVKTIKTKLNAYLSKHYTFDDDPVIIAPLFEHDSLSANCKNKLSVFVVNLEKDTTYKKQIHNISSGGSNFNTAPPLYLNMHIMIGAYFDTSRYEQSLQLLSTAIQCFQELPVIDRENTPGMPETIEKLMLDIENISIRELSNLWGMLGGRYYPSILYRVRVVTIDGQAIISRSHPASSPEISTKKLP